MKKLLFGIICSIFLFSISCKNNYTINQTNLEYRIYDFLLYDKYPIKIKIPKELKLIDIESIDDIYRKENCFIRDTSTCNTFRIELSQISLQTMCNTEFESFEKKHKHDSSMVSNINFKSNEIRLFSVSYGNAQQTKIGFEFLKHDFNTMKLLLIIQRKKGIKYVFHSWVYKGNKSKKQIQNYIDLYDKIQIEDYSVK